MFVIIEGNVVDGVKIIGPFKTIGAASLYAEHFDLDDYVVDQLESPNDATICELCHAPVWEQEWEES